jgi:gamma-glutamyltranspeptidase/glutathione hydrolase
MSIDSAVAAKRFHHQWLPDRLYIEKDGVSSATQAALEAMGYRVQMVGGQGTAHSIRVDPRTGIRRGAADPRDADAGAAGY